MIYYKYKIDGKELAFISASEEMANRVYEALLYKEGADVSDFEIIDMYEFNRIRKENEL